MARLKFLNNYFYGRSDQPDFTEADLPVNRKQLFKDVLRTRIGSMVGVNLLYLLFWLPAVIWSFINLVAFYNLDLTTNAGEQLHHLLFNYLTLLFPLIALTGPFNMGVSYIMRNWARDEHSFVWADFRDALKANWKQGLLYGVISGFMPMFAYIGMKVYLDFAKLSPVFYLPMGITLFIALVWWHSSLLLPTMIVTYRLNFFGLVKNAVLLSLALLPKAVLVRLLTLLFPILIVFFAVFVPGAFAVVLATTLVLYSILLLAFNKLLTASYANAVCEKYLNTRIPGARTNIGLRPDMQTTTKGD